MNRTTPLVSIILPTKNRVKLLPKAIDSVLAQTFTDWELNVIDNSSNDETDRLMNEYSASDCRIKYSRIPNSNIPGISQYLNYGINNSTGKYIARLDDDDKWCFPDKLLVQVDFLESHSDYVLVGGGVIMVDSNNTELYRFYKRETDQDIRNNALLACPFEHTTVVFRRDSAIKLGGYAPYEVAEDWEFFLRLGKLGKMYNFKEYFTEYLQGAQNLSLKNQDEVALCEIRIIKKFKNDYPHYRLGTALHILQYLYSFVPGIIKDRFQFYLRYIKRNYF
ncbi:MAG: glycosyltransferase [Ignavibacteria bacterium]|nr:glycosyltransferase [Ignavibacteria bacterium]MBK6876238.1 glycosyltransferase [Ignavibacteria bacterium]MBK9226776.1 glycosyltransferase [Ignavibacteria bacterium]